MRKNVIKYMTLYEGLQRTWKGLQARSLVPKYVDLPANHKNMNQINFRSRQFHKSVYKILHDVTDVGELTFQRHEAFIGAYI